MNQKLRDDKDAIEAAHEAVSYTVFLGEAIRFKVICHPSSDHTRLDKVKPLWRPLIFPLVR